MKIICENRNLSDIAYLTALILVNTDLQSGGKFANLSVITPVDAGAPTAVYTKIVDL